MTTCLRFLLLSGLLLLCSLPLLAQDTDNDGITDGVECAGTTSSFTFDGDFAGSNATNTTGTLNITASVPEGPEVFGTLNQPVSTTLTLNPTPGEIVGDRCDWLVTNTGRFDDGLHVSIDGTVVLQFNFRHYGFQAAFRTGGKFDTDFNGQWTPWTAEGNPELRISSDGTMALLVDTRGGGREDALDDMRRTGAGPNAFIFNLAPLLRADCRQGIDFLMLQSNQGGPGRRPGYAITASVEACTDDDGDGIPDDEDPCFPGPTLVLNTVTDETDCGAGDGTASLEVNGGLIGQSYTLDLTNTSTGESATFASTGSPATFAATGLVAGDYVADVTDDAGDCTVNQVTFSVTGEVRTPASTGLLPLLWLRADADVETAAANQPQILTWGDQSPNNNDALSDGSVVTLSTTDFRTMNFNPSVTFDPTVDPLGRLAGSDALGLAATGSMEDFTFFIVPRNTDGEGGTCGDGVFNFYDDENLFELENFIPLNGCEQFVNNFTYGVFNGGNVAPRNIDNRNNNILSFDYSRPGGRDNFNFYANGSGSEVTQVVDYIDPAVLAQRVYSIGQSANNRVPGNIVAPVIIGEIIAFPGVLTDAERETVNSYLAIKYGIDLFHSYRDGSGMVIWDRDGDRAAFSNNVIGLARNDCGNFSQRQSTATLPNTPLTIANGTIAPSNADNPNEAAADMSYLLVGNNGERPVFLGSGGSDEYANRNFRTYKVTEMIDGTPADAYQDLDLRFDRIAAELPDAPAGTFVLLIDRDGDGDFSNAEAVTNAVYDADGNLFFEGVDLDHGDCFTLARPTCDLTIQSIITDCQNGDEFNLTVNVDYDYRYNSPATPGQIVVDVLGERFFSEELASPTGSTSITFTLTGNFAQEGLVVSFVTDDICSDTEFLNLLSCDLACVAQPDAITGTVFPDYNLNGLRDVGEGGAPGATVLIYDCDGNLVGSQVTTPTGGYSIAGLDPGQDYRVEFVTQENSLSSGSYVDPNNPFTVSDVQFAPAGTCNLNLGAITPDFCTLEQLQYVTTCFTRLNPAQNPNADAVISFKATGGSNSNNALDYLQPPEHPVNLGVGDVGPVNGVAFDRRLQRLYMSTTVKAETSFPAGGTIADIYVADNTTNDGSDASVNSATRLVNLEADCGFDVGGYITDFEIPGAIADGVDDAIFETVGEIGIGDIDLNQEGNILFATNLFTRSLIVLPLDDAGGPVCGAAVEIPIPEPPSSVGTGVVRPWAIGRRPGFPDMYVGAVADASISDDRSDLRAYVFRFDVASRAFDPTPVLDFPLDYPRQTNFASRIASDWLPWVEDRNDAARRAQATYCCGTTFFVTHPQPIFSDIDFDRGDMILGFMDRFANQLSQVPSTSPKKFSAGDDFIIPCGDMLRAGLNPDLSSWTLENGGITNGVVAGRLESGDLAIEPSPPNADAGPGGEEFYFQDNYYNHYEVTLGGIAAVPGNPIATNAWDIVRGVPAEYATGGVMFFENNSGRWIKSYKLYGGIGPDVPGNFGKGAGFGDIEPICEPIRVQIGNLVFVDEDMDGVQDPCDRGIPGVPVALFAPDGTLRATTVTNEQGEYYFSAPSVASENWVDPTDSLQAEDEVVIVFGYDALDPAASTYDPDIDILSAGDETFVLTLVEQEGAPGSSDRVDSDADTTAAPGLPWDTYPFLTRTLGLEQTFFDLDAGFIPQQLDLALIKTIDPSPTGQYRLGDAATFTITVVNQGTKPVRTISLKDVFYTGLAFDAAANTGVPVTQIPQGGAAAQVQTTDWTQSADSLTTTLMIPGPLGFAPGDTLRIPLTMTLVSPDPTDPQRFLNVAEITSVFDLNGLDVSDQDVDSTPDTILGNDAGGRPRTASDNALDGDGTGVPNDLFPLTDEDDSDPEVVPIYDIALTKGVVVASLGADGMPNFGERIEFFITLVNQGTEVLTSVEIFDALPCGYTVEVTPNFLLTANRQAGWTGGNLNGLRLTLPTPLRPGATTRVALFAILQNPVNDRPGCGMNEDLMPYENDAEVASVSNSAGTVFSLDFDSVLDEKDDNEDGGGIVNDLTDGVVTGDGTGVKGSNDPLTDDDDHDVANVDVIDVALRKYLADQTTDAFLLGNTVELSIAVFGQGNVPVTEFDVVDYLPAGLEYNAALNDPLGWSYDPAIRQATNSLAVMPGLTMGDSISVSIFVDVLTVPPTTENYTNRAEITRFFIDPMPNPNLMGLAPLMAGYRTTDADSRQDNDPDNDPGGVVLTDDDDNIDGLGFATNEDEDDADPAFVPVFQPIVIGDTAFVDVDRNGIQSGPDLAAAGVTVTLTLSDGTPVTTDLYGNPYISVRATDADGRYLFDSLPAGNYVVTFDFSTITTGNPDLYIPVAANGSSNDAIDSDADVTTGAAPPTGNLMSGDTLLTIDAGVQCFLEADALGDAAPTPVICEDDVLTLADLQASVTPASNGGTWTTTGDGTFNAAGNFAAALTYTPGPNDIANGGVTLRLRNNFPPASTGCMADQDEVFLRINRLPTVSLGPDRTICEDATISLVATVTGSTGGTWTSSGSGTFNNPTGLLTVYDPSAADAAAGSVILTYTTDDPAGPCPAVSDDLLLTLNPVAIAGAGDEQTVCEGDVIRLAGSYGGAATRGTWSGGTGTYTPGPGFPTATYVPSEAEIIAGSATLTFTTNDPDGPCGPVSDMVTLTINNIPMVDAGPDQTICQEDVASLSATVTFTNGSVSTDGSWTTTATAAEGTLTDLGDGSATFTPEPGAPGSYDFFFTADDPDGAGPCPGTRMDTVTITVRPAPIALLSDRTVCADEIATFNAAAQSRASGALSFQWQNDAPGSFSDVFNETDPDLTINSTPTTIDGRAYRVIVFEEQAGLTCATTSAPARLIVNPRPACFIDGPAVVGTNQQGVVYTAPAGLTYAWSVVQGDATFAGPADAQTVTVNFGVDDILLELTTTDENGCTQTCDFPTGTAALSLGSTVFEDLNNNGRQDPGENGIPGVSIQLLRAASGNEVLTGPDGALNTGDETSPDPVVTDADGNYLFNNLFPDEYIVRIRPENFTTGGALEFLSVSSNATTSGFMELSPDDGDVDGDDNGLQPGGIGTVVNSLPVTLEVGGEPTAASGETAQGSDQDDADDDSNGNMTVDFGFFAPIPGIGDFVFADLNGDGRQDGDEPGLAGVTVTLFNADGTPVDFQSDGASPYPNVTTTDENGEYLFESLPPGNYYVEFDLSTADNADLYVFTLPDQDANDEIDSDAQTTDDITGLSDTTGFLPSGTLETSIDAGVVCNITVTVADPFTICGTQPVDLTADAEVLPETLGGFWTASGDGAFLNAAGNPVQPPFTVGKVFFYQPGTRDARTGSVTLTLTSADPGNRTPPSACGQVEASVTIQVLQVDCGDTFWDGGE